MLERQNTLIGLAKRHGKKAATELAIDTNDYTEQKKHDCQSLPQQIVNTSGVGKRRLAVLMRIFDK